MEAELDFRAARLDELSAAVRARTVSSRELVAHAIGRLEAVNATLNAFVAWDGERALAQAQAIDDALARGEEGGPLAGIPIGVKDLEDAAGFVTTHGSELRRDAAPAERDSLPVGRLRAAGCVVLGKTNAPEYGHKPVTDNLLFGPTRNPWHLDYSAGGSSGGSAAALAAGIVPLATGSDGGGSIRIPAALCGLSGLKSTQGRVPIPGTAGPGTGLMTVDGPMGVTARDIAYALDVVAGPHPGDPFSLPASDVRWADAIRDAGPIQRVVWSPTMGFAEVDSQVRAACESAIGALADSGCEVLLVDDVLDEDPFLEFVKIWTVSRRKILGHLEGTADWERIDPSLRFLIEYGREVDAVDYARTLDACYELNSRLASVLAQAPVLLTPTCAGLTPLVGGEGTVDGEPQLYWTRFPPPLNMTRHPAGTVCVGRSAEGLPIGMQVIGPHFDEAIVLRAMAQLEELVDFHVAPPLTSH